MIKKIECKIDSSVRDALKIIDVNGYGTCFVTDNDNRVIGVLTDGDLRRALLNGHDLNSNINNIINKDFVYALSTDIEEDIISKLNEEIKIIPILDDHSCMVDFLSYDQVSRFPVSSPDLYGKEREYLMDAFLSTWISSSGEYIKKFETGFSSYSDCKHGVAVSNGTVAIQLALMSIGVKPGDEVILPDLTFGATINAILAVGATPVLVDIDEDSWCISPEKIKRSISKKTVAIIVVHLYGQPADILQILDIANEHNIKVIEDCAEAHGAKVNGKSVGSFGEIGCYSFFANKIITSGEGGMCVTNSDKLFEKMNLLKNHGMSPTKKYWHETPGFNFRLTNIQAAIGLAQFERIESMLQNRKEYEIHYKKIFNNKSITLQFQNDLINRDRVVWLVCGLAKNFKERERIIDDFKKINIDTRNFFYALSDMPAFKKYSNFECSVAKNIASRGISFPTFNNLNRLDEIINKINSKL